MHAKDLEYKIWEYEADNMEDMCKGKLQTLHTLSSLLSLNANPCLFSQLKHRHILHM